MMLRSYEFPVVEKKANNRIAYLIVLRKKPDVESCLCDQIGQNDSF